MAIQILGFREREGKHGKVYKTEDFFKKGIRAQSVKEVLDNYSALAEQINPSERYNLFFTLADCLEEPGRKMITQDVIMFDIDGIDKEKKLDYIDPVCRVIGVSKDDISISFTGNGLHFYIQLDEPIKSDTYFKDNRDAYKILCKDIDKVLFEECMLHGEADSVVFCAGKMGRLPTTENRKKDKKTEVVELLVNNLRPISFKFNTKLLPDDVVVTEAVSDQEFTLMAKPDTESVQSECTFLKYCFNNQERISEPEWYAALSILGRLGENEDEGRAIAHSYSEGHSGYVYEEANDKITRAITASGPRTCKDIAGLGDWCESCSWKGVVRTPIAIKGDDYITTERDGFYNMILNKKTGELKRGQPNYEDLRKAFERDYKYATIDESRILYVYDTNHYKLFPISRLEAYAQEKFNPSPKTAMRQEFVNLIRCTNLQPNDWTNVEGMINFQNGVLDLNTKQLLPHSQEYGFRYCLDYDYDPIAECPRFDKFMQEITCNDEELIRVLMEYFGYAFSNKDPRWGEKALILVGEGSNGKSVLLSTMCELAGKDNYAVNTLTDLQSENNRFSLMGKLFNVAEETPRKGLLDSALFKNLCTGGETTVKLMYHHPFKIKNYCKLLFACNELPYTKDMTLGLHRRLLIVPFRATFSGVKVDRDIGSKLLTEKSGIFNRVIEGYDRLIKQQNFSESTEVTQAVKNYVDDIDMAKAWFDDSVDILPDNLEDTKVLDFYEDFKMYAEERGERPMDYVTFTKRLRVFIPDNFFRRTRSNGRRITIIKGYKLGVEENF